MGPESTLIVYFVNSKEHLYKAGCKDDETKLNLFLARVWCLLKRYQVRPRDNSRKTQATRIMLCIYTLNEKDILRRGFQSTKQFSARRKTERRQDPIQPFFLYTEHKCSWLLGVVILCVIRNILESVHLLFQAVLFVFRWHWRLFWFKRVRLSFNQPWTIRQKTA